jgi:hypothetical protein
MTMLVRAWIIALLVLAGAVSIPAQTPTERSRQSALERLWRNAPATDTTALTRLTDSTSALGEPGARALLGIVADSTLDPVRRLYALWGLQAYWGEWIITCAYLFPYSGPQPHMHEECGPGEALQPVTQPSFEPDAANPTVFAGGQLRMASVEPQLRDTIVSRLQGVIRQQGSVTEAIAEFLRLYGAVERWNPERRAECEQLRRGWTAALAMHPGAPPFELQYQLPGNLCTEVGPPLIAQAWRVVQPDAESLRRLAWSTAHLRDRRILDALIATARNSARPLQVRIAAIDILGTQLHPGVIRPATLSLAISPRRRFMCDMPLPQRSNAQWNGGQPPDQQALTRGRSALAALAASDPSPEIRREARAVADCARDVAVAIRRFIAP